MAFSRHIFKPLYCFGIVRGGDHDARRIVELADGEIQFVGGGQPQVDGVGALLGDAAKDRVGQCRAKRGAYRAQRPPGIGFK